MKKTNNNDIEIKNMRLDFLLEASKILTSSLDYHTTLKNVAKSSIPKFADWCSVHLVTSEKEPQQIIAAHADSSKVSLVEKLQKEYPADPDAPRGIYNILRTGKPEYMPIISPELIKASARSKTHLKLLQTLNLKSYISVPLSYRDQIFGVISFVTAESERIYNQNDLEVALDLANRAAVAIENAKLYNQAQLEIKKREETEAQLIELTQNLETRVVKRTQELYQANQKLIQEAVARKQIETEKSLLSKKHELILNSIGEGVYGVDSQGKLSFINPAAEKILERDYETLKNKSIHELIHYKKIDGREYPNSECPIVDSYTRGKITRIEREHYFKPDGTPIPVEYIAAPLKEKGEVVGAVITFTDISERLAAQEELNVLNAELLNSNRELENFASVASHDLQEPLRKIRAFGDRLNQKHAANFNEEARDYLDRMLNAAARMQRLIEDLLQFSRITTQGREFDQVDLNEVLVQVISDLEYRIEETQGIVKYERMPILSADKLQMRQLFQNLIGNSLKFHQKDIPPVVNIYTNETIVNENEKMVNIYIEDNGIGFEEEYSEKIFTLFQRLHARHDYEGTGIGLAICKKIIERHNGQITTSSKLGQGTTFIITLPMGG